jgi:hypothetical protein
MAAEKPLPAPAIDPSLYPKNSFTEVMARAKALQNTKLGQGIVYVNAPYKSEKTKARERAQALSMSRSGSEEAEDRKRRMADRAKARADRAAVAADYATGKKPVYKGTADQTSPDKPTGLKRHVVAVKAGRLPPPPTTRAEPTVTKPAASKRAPEPPSKGVTWGSAGRSKIHPGKPAERPTLVEEMTPRKGAAAKATTTKRAPAPARPTAGKRLPGATPSASKRLPGGPAVARKGLPGSSSGAAALRRGARGGAGDSDTPPPYDSEEEGSVGASDDSSDMEAGVSDIEFEEEKTLRTAKWEDAVEKEREVMAKRRKQVMLKKLA